jgi:hypothetical protein
MGLYPARGSTRRQLEVPTMKRLLQSLAKSLRAAPIAPAPRHRTSVRAAAFTIAEGLESRMLLAADLSGGMLSKFNIPTSAAGTGYQPGIVTAAGGGANGASSTSDGDDTIERAHHKSIEFTFDGTISDGLDVDMFRFTVNKGKHVTFDIDRPSGSQLDSVLRLFNSAGQEVAVSDDDPSPTEPNSLESYIDFTFTVSGTYYIAVSGGFNDGYNAVTGAGDVTSPSTGRYHLIAQNYQNRDSNDTITTFEATLGKTDQYSDVISWDTDVDLFRIKVDAGDKIAFDIDPDVNFPNDPLDSYLRLMDDNNVQLAANDDGDDPTEPPNNPKGPSYFEYTFAEGGTYYIGVSSSDNKTYNDITGAGDTTGGPIGHFTLYTTLLNP